MTSAFLKFFHCSLPLPFFAFFAFFFTFLGGSFFWLSGGVAASEENLGLRTGGHITYSDAQSFEKVKDQSWGGGFSSSLDYQRGGRWRFSLTSNISLLSFKKMNLKVAGIRVQGKGSIQRVSFAPLIGHFFGPIRKGRWLPYISAGPVWIIETIRFSSPQVQGGTFEDDKRNILIFRGAQLGVGIERQFSSKSKKFFIELIYNFATAKRIYLVNESRELEIKEALSRRSIRRHILFLNIGFQLF